MNVLRWILILPIAFICGVFAAIIALAISRNTPAKIITGFIAGGIFVWAGGLIAPTTHKTDVIIVLAIINVIYSLSQAKSLELAPGKRVDWLSISRAFGGIAAAVCEF